MQKPLFIKWNDRYDIGIHLIDEQHRAIVSIINTLYYMMNLGADSHKLYLSIIETIKNYSHIHFRTEEGLLEASGYQDLEKHKELHAKLNLEMERIGRTSLGPDGPGPLLDFLKRWWISHINEKDRLYVPHLAVYFKDR